MGKDGWSPEMPSAWLSGAPRKLARQGGFEPPTPRSEVWCSNPLSYWRADRVYHRAEAENNRGARRPPYPAWSSAR
jgi:hypothetical protein